MKKSFCEKTMRIAMSGAISLLILSVFTFIYNYSGIHIANSSGETDYKWQPCQYKATMEEGFSWFRMDENGFNNSIPSEDALSLDSVDILLMGSSHMEAVEVFVDENTGYLLNELAPEYSTYNIGISGHTIYNCVNNMESAASEYEPSQYIVLETADIKLDMDKMKAVIGGEYPHIQSYDSGALYLLQKYIPAVKSLYKAVENWADAGSNSVQSMASEDVSQDDYYDALNAFLEKASVDADGKLVIFYQPQTRVDETGAFANNGDSEYRELFALACEAHGIKFIDMTDDFENLYETEHILAHGFVNTAVGEGHLNKYGHRVIAKRLVEELHLSED